MMPPAPLPPAAARWFRRQHRVESPRLRLVCFPHAGGSPAAYRTWHRHLPEDVEVLAVCYPGRQDRIGDPFPTGAAELAEEVTAALAPLRDVPVALFGHSMGALLAYEVAVRLAADPGAPPPVRLFVSGSPAPHLVDHSALRSATDEDLLALVDALGSDSTDALRIPALRELLMPGIRADFRLLAHYRATTTTTDFPVVACTGDDDPVCAVEAARAWSTTTVSAFELNVFPGGHFYLEPLEAELLGRITGHLRSDLRFRTNLRPGVPQSASHSAPRPVPPPAAQSAQTH
ncbi:alpha/beta fold hydrolase [Kitasatospora purpeofusca]|uniref:thioesterase II family protein n=1 Tax=Kitasatospora purpeofusca TaxID=67352 RepID=UPI0022587BAB|nr:alpha/beta fold hydrolase [Kitasatospora purpeofusca]MCX4687109.1 alpha/beta fold hydrolase [Kitasatospora purpeofusca]